MAGIRSNNTSPEMLVRKLLFNQGFRYRLHQKNLPGRPDIVLRKHNAVILVHGCFWHLHRCRLSKIPTGNREFWQAKLSRNKERDQEQLEALQELGWRTAVVWECATRQQKLRAELARVLRCWLLGDSLGEEFSLESLHASIRAADHSFITRRSS